MRNLLWEQPTTCCNGSGKRELQEAVPGRSVVASPLAAANPRSALQCVARVLRSRARATTADPPHPTRKEGTMGQETGPETGPEMGQAKGQEIVPPDRPRSNGLHPYVYGAIAALVAWFILSIWSSFASDGYTDWLLTVVS